MAFHLKNCVAGTPPPMYPVLSEEKQGHGTTSLAEAQELTAAMIESLKTIKNMEEQIKELQTRLAASLEAAELESKKQNNPLNVPITGVLKFVPIAAVEEQPGNNLSSPYRGAPSIGCDCLPASGILQIVAKSDFPEVKESIVKPLDANSMSQPAEEYISICGSCNSTISYVRLTDGIQRCSNCDDADNRFIVATKDINEGVYPVICSEDMRRFKENKKLEEHQQQIEKEQFTLTYSHVAIGIIGFLLGSFLSTAFEDSGSSYSRNCRRY